MSNNTDALKTNLGEAGTHLKQAAAAAGDALKSAASAAGEQVDALMDKGRDLIDSAAELIRERPLAAFGVAFATGWIIAKLARSEK